MKLFPVLLFLAFAHAGCAQSSVVPSVTPGPALDKSQLLKLVNEARRKGCNCGNAYFKPVPQLEWNDQLQNAAERHSRDMNANRYFNHISPAGKGPGDRIEEAGYRWKAYGENIGLGYRSEQEVVEGWLQSPGHCRNIMSKDYREMGVGRSGNYWTQTFGAK